MISVKEEAIALEVLRSFLEGENGFIKKNFKATRTIDSESNAYRYLRLFKEKLENEYDIILSDYCLKFLVRIRNNDFTSEFGQFKNLTFEFAGKNTINTIEKVILENLDSITVASEFFELLYLLNNNKAKELFKRICEYEFSLKLILLKARIETEVNVLDYIVYFLLSKKIDTASEVYLKKRIRPFIKKSFRDLTEKFIQPLDFENFNRLDFICGILNEDPLEFRKKHVISDTDILQNLGTTRKEYFDDEQEAYSSVQEMIADILANEKYIDYELVKNKIIDEDLFNNTKICAFFISENIPKYLHLVLPGHKPYGKDVNFTKSVIFSNILNALFDKYKNVFNNHLVKRRVVILQGEELLKFDELDQIKKYSLNSEINISQFINSSKKSKSKSLKNLLNELADA